MKNIEKLKSILTENILLSSLNLDEENIDEMLDKRDSKDFEEKWLSAFHKIEQLEKSRPLTIEENTELNKICEAAFKEIFALTQHSELASYVSDDFELLGKYFHLNSQDEWLNSMYLIYSEGKFPH